jgi:two-component system phosphate regulon sensor histidine kinase PhoR
MVSYLVAIAVVLTAGLIYLHFGLSAQLMEQAIGNLARNARLARRHLVSSTTPPFENRRMDALANEMGQALGVRVTIIASGGHLLGDSELTADELKVAENHAGRPEVIYARQKGIGTSVRHSRTVGRDLLYMALSVDEGSASGSVIRLAMSLREIEETIGKMRGLLFVAGAFAFLLAIAVSFGAGVIVRRGFHDIDKAVEKISQGDFAHRIGSLRKDELGVLARTMDRLAGEIEIRLAELGNERDQLEAILEGMTEGVMVTDHMGHILLVNSAMRKFFPSLPLLEDGSKIPIEAIRSSEVQEAVRAMASQRGGRLDREVEVLGIPPRTLIMHGTMQSSGRESNLVLVFHDVTEIKQLERIRRDFTANVSHELRTPLTAIQGASETLQEIAYADPEAARRFSSTIFRHARRLSVLVEDLLELGRIESKTEHIRPEKISLRHAVESAKQILASSLEKRRIRLEVGISNGADQIFADPAAMERILINLIENGVNYSLEGSVISVTGDLFGENYVEVSVADQGEGIPPDHIPRIFERFYRVDSARSRDRGGTGLGLSIVKHLVQEMGGEVRVESVVGKGSTFRFTIPKA